MAYIPVIDLSSSSRRSCDMWNDLKSHSKGTLLQSKTGYVAKQAIQSQSDVNYDLIKTDLFCLGGVIGNFTNLYLVGSNLSHAGDKGSASTFFGISSVFGFITGLIGICQNTVNYFKAKKVNNIWNMTHSLCMGIRYTGSFIASGIGVAYRTVTILAAQQVTHISRAALTALRTALFTTSMGVYALMGAPYLVRGIKSAIDYHRFNQALENGTSETEKLKSAIAYFMEYLELNEQERDKLTQNCVGSHEGLNREELNSLTQADLKFLDEKNLGAPEYKAAAKALAHRKMEKASHFDKVFGSRVREFIQQELHQPEKERITDCLTSDIEDVRLEAISKAQEVMELAKADANKHLTLYFAIAGLCFVGIAAFIMATVASGGGALLAALVIMQVVGIVMLAVDGYELKQVLKNTNASPFDKFLLSMINVLIVGATITAGVFSGGVLPLVFAIITGISTLLMNLYVIGEASKEKDEGQVRDSADYTGGNGLHDDIDMHVE